MIRLLMFLITGFWPSHRSLMALGKRLDRLEEQFATYKRRLDRLWGAYYAMGETPDVAADRSAPGDEFPEEEFQTQLALKRGGTIRGTSSAG